MFKGIAGQIALAMTLIVVLPMALEAQESARVRVSAHVVQSVRPDTEAAAAAQLVNIAETGMSDVNIEKQSVGTERGFAQVTTESLAPTHDATAGQNQVAAEADADADQARVLITVAFIAN